MYNVAMFTDSARRDERNDGMIHFIYNPIAGKGKSRRFFDRMKAMLAKKGVPHRFYETHGRGEAREIADRLTEPAGKGDIDIVSMGGDGTLNEVLNGLRDPSNVRLGIVPCGSGNDFAAIAGIPDTPEGALALLTDGQAKYTDYLECAGVRGINAIGTGIDVDILRRFNRMKLLKGSAAYLASLILTLFEYRPRRFSELLGGEERPHRAFIACAGNGQCIGGGIPICPEAKIDDGLMDIVIVDDIRRTRIPGAFMKLMKRKIMQLPTTRFRRDTRLCIRADGPMPIQIDGEIYDDLPFDVRVVPGVLRVYRP